MIPIFTSKPYVIEIEGRADRPVLFYGSKKAPATPKGSGRVEGGNALVGHVGSGRVQTPTSDVP